MSMKKTTLDHKLYNRLTNEMLIELIRANDRFLANPDDVANREYLDQISGQAMCLEEEQEITSKLKTSLSNKN